MVEKDCRLANDFSESVCAKCGSNKISINMFFNVWKQKWHYDDPEYWCHECNNGEYNFCHKDDYEEGELI